MFIFQSFTQNTAQHPI